MFPEKPRLPTVTVDSATQAVVRHYWDLTEAIRALEEERNALLSGELEVIPDGVRIDVPDSPVYLLRTRERVTASLVDITKVEEHFLQPKLVSGLAAQWYRDHQEPPSGVAIKTSRGLLSFRKRR